MAKVTYEHVDPAKLKKHPLSIAIYGDTPDPEFVASCKDGIIQPIVITADFVIVCGHSRVQAARIHKFKTIAAIIRRDLTDPLEIETEVIRSNRGREKTVEQKAREYEQLKRIEAAKAAKRQAATQVSGKSKTQNSSRKAGDEKVSEPATNGEAAHIAAEHVGLSKPTAEKAVEVVHKIDELKAAGETAKAEELAETLEKNVSRAHREATAEPGPEPEKPTEPSYLPEVFGKRTWYRSTLTAIGGIINEIREVGASPAGAMLDLQDCENALKQAQNCLKFAAPHAICPICKRKPAKGCKLCKGRGWLGRLELKLITDEQKAWLEENKV